MKKTATLIFSLFAVPMLIALAIQSCGEGGQNPCEKAKEIALKGYQKYCAGKEEICGSCNGCNGNVTALETIWNTEGTETFTICITDNPDYKCEILDELGVDACQCGDLDLLWANACLEDEDACRQGWMDLAQASCEKSML